MRRRRGGKMHCAEKLANNAGVRRWRDDKCIVMIYGENYKYGNNTKNFR